MRHQVTVYFQKARLTTAINGSEDEVRAYYVGKSFNLGDDKVEFKDTARFVDFLDKSLADRQKDALQAAVDEMVNDQSDQKDRPWVPGSVCGALKSYLQDVLSYQEAGVASFHGLFPG